MNLFEAIKRQLNLTDEALYEMANIQPWESGLPSEIYCIFNGKNTIKQHASRIKVMTSKGWFPIPLDKEINTRAYNRLKKEDQYKVDAAVKYVNSHKELFIKHWNGEISDNELFKLLKLKSRAK